MKIQNHQNYLLLAAIAFSALGGMIALSAALQKRLVSSEDQGIGPNKPDKNAESMNSSTTSEKVIEILTLDIKPGRRDEFHKRYVTKSVPLLKKSNFNLVAYGPSLHDANSYYVIRAFKSLEDRQVSEDAFYSSDDWKQGSSGRDPRSSRPFCIRSHFRRDLEKSSRVEVFERLSPQMKE